MGIYIGNKIVDDSEISFVEKKGMNSVKKYNGKYYDFGTLNKSFLEVAYFLKSKGIKNWMWPLEIKNPKVALINPYAKNISSIDAGLVQIEMASNMIYYMRELARCKITGGTCAPIKCNRGVLAAIFCAMRGISYDLCIKRQKGKTMIMSQILIWAFLIGTNDTRLIMYHIEMPKCKKNLEDIKVMTDYLPKYIRPNLSKNSAEQYVNADNRNEMVLNGKAINEEKAQNTARGHTSSVFALDEFEFLPFVDTTVDNSISAYASAMRMAIETNSFYCYMCISTPGNLDNDSSIRAYKIIENMGRFDEFIYDLEGKFNDILPIDERSEITNYVLKISRNKFLYIEFNYKELFISEAEIRSEASSMSDIVKIKREIFLHRLSGSDKSPWGQDELDELRFNTKNPIYEVRLGPDKYFVLHIYKEIEKNKVYGIGVDVASGLGADNTAITIIDKDTYDIIAELRSSYLDEVELSDILIEILDKVVPLGVLCIERNSVGHATMKLISKSRYANRIYYDRGRDLITSKMDRRMSSDSLFKIKSEASKYEGVWTGGESRKSMMTILMNRMSKNRSQFVTKFINEDICKLERNTSGNKDRIEAAPGMHDDNIMSYLICMYVLIYGNNLDRFGLIPEIIIEDKSDEEIIRDTLDSLPDEPEFEAIRDKLKSDIDRMDREKKEFELRIGDITEVEDEISIYNSINSGEPVTRQTRNENHGCISDDIFYSL